MYDWKGRYIEEDDPPEPTQPHCPTCGAFLPWQPTGTRTRLAWADQETIYNVEGDPIDFIIHHEEYEDEEYWHCKRCGEDRLYHMVFPT